MKRVLILISLLTILNSVTVAFAKQSFQQVPFTQEDKERLIRLEEGQKSINQRLDQISDDIKNMRDDAKWNFRLLLGAIAIMIGLLFWDRRTAISSVEKRIRELEVVIATSPAKLKAKAHK
ncbi:MAG: hypothetical protein HZC10_00660 [Nitrospirae bacterium]|nr:hypothetical protein [Nitrospirota bacterium]